jgi:hypothetical protein
MNHGFISQYLIANGSSLFANSLWDLSAHFREDSTVLSSLNKLIHSLQEMNKFHTILLDQASRTILKNLTSFVKKYVGDSLVSVFRASFSATLEACATTSTISRRSRPNSTASWCGTRRRRAARPRKSRRCRTCCWRSGRASGTRPSITSTASVCCRRKSATRFSARCCRICTRARPTTTRGPTCAPTWSPSSRPWPMR